MSVDILQDKIRKLKNPTMLELCLSPADLPATVQTEEGSAAAYRNFCRELLAQLKDTVPAVRVSFLSFALLGGEGMDAMENVLSYAKKLGYYVLLDAPELPSPQAASMTAEAFFGKECRFHCDGLIIGGYAGSDLIKPFLPYTVEGKKDLFVVARNANKSAPELQDLLAGGRLVHVAAADHVNRYGGDSMGKFGYSRVGILTAASSAESLRSLRAKYPKLFFLMDGADYPNANAKNCAQGFDKLGRGAVAIVGRSITCAWKNGESDGTDYLSCAQAAADRMKKNLNRYITIL